MHHELFHFRFDLYALHQELTLKRVLYNPYSAEVYAIAWLTKGCYEESLANLACLTVAPRYILKHISPGSAMSDVRNFVQDFCADGPSGCRDFDRPRASMRMQLGGQLLEHDVSASMLEPQARWVGSPSPLYSRRACPTHLLKCRPRYPDKGRFLCLKHGGLNWYVHPNDQDPFPSKPHAHEYSKKLKLHLGNGQMFDKGSRKQVGRLGRADLQLIRQDTLNSRPGLTLP